MCNDRVRVEKVAQKMIKENGLINLTRAELCERSGIKTGSFAVVMGMSFTRFCELMAAKGNYGPSKPVTKTRALRIARKESLIITGLAVAERDGYNNLTRESIAESAGVSPGLVSSICGTMPQLRRDIMRAAVRLRAVAVVAEGIASKNPHALKADQALRDKVNDYLGGL